MALKVILDTRFYFSYYNPENKKIADWSKRVIQKISKGQIKAASSTITITELYNTMGRILGTDAIKIRIASAKGSNIKIIPVTEDIAELAGKITLNTPKIPLADAIIAATAIIHAKGIAVTDDEHFKTIKDIKVKWLKNL
ncbi:MAG: PIN domain-containing protein [Candidatus Bathyarchaeota archaeon]|nr:PIN domain-containing protein [Candidatus Bathyarchaeota archaeon]